MSKFPNFPHSVICAVSQDVRAYGISSTVIIDEAYALTEWKKCYACRSGSCQCVRFKHRICFYVIFTHPPVVAVHRVAFVRVMVTCHIAKRSTPKHSARYRWSIHGSDEDSRTSCYTHFLSLSLFLFLSGLSQIFPQFTSPLTPLHHKDNLFFGRPHQHVHHCTAWVVPILWDLWVTLFFSCRFSLEWDKVVNERSDF